MKIILEGKKELAQWWVGAVVTCRTCGRKTQLEDGDEIGGHVNVIHPKALVFCSTCGDTTTITNPNGLQNTTGPVQ